MTTTSTTTHTFTRTSAQYLASKVVTDLRRLYSYYAQPTEAWIDKYYAELVEFLAYGYLDSVEYGFKLGDKRVLSLLYEVRSDGSLSDGRPGGVHARADVSGASWFSFLSYSRGWSQAPQTERDRFAGRLPFQRGSGTAPVDGTGYWMADHSYSADGVATQRRVFRPY